MDIQGRDGLPAELRKKIYGILRVLFPDSTIYLYGSRARGDFHDKSDIDIAIDNGQGKERLRLGEAQSVLEGLKNPYKIDIIDLNYVPQPMRNIIIHEGIKWQL